MASSNASGASAEEPFGEIFEQIQDMLSLIVNGHLTAICAATGVPLNIFCIFVFLRSRGTTPIIQYYLVSPKCPRAKINREFFVPYLDSSTGIG